MPHRVANFLRTSSGNIHRKTTTTPQNPRAGSSSPYNSDSEDSNSNHNAASVTSLAVKMPDLAEVVKKHHRISLPFVGRASSKERNQQASSSSLGLSWSIESPPIVFHGNPDDSTGALVSGQLFLEVKDEVVEMKSFSANLNIHVVQKKPFTNHCSDCQNQHTELEKWSFLSLPTTLPRGKHAYPFSVLLSGHLPATVDTPVLSISYDFVAQATYAVSSPTGSAGFLPCTPLKFERGLTVRRSQPEFDIPHHSVRIFPPTNIKASAHYMSVIHPTGANNVTLKLDGLMSANHKGKSVDIWKLKRVTWRLEETIKTVAPACDKHSASLAAAAANGSQTALQDAEDPNSRKGMVRKETRMLGEKQLHDGWKSDYSGSDGIVDFEFDYTVKSQKPQGRDLKYACDSRSRDGTEITHSLVIELVVSREYAPEGKPHLSAPTGTGRILRMHYGVVMTEYPGLGVSWDNEAPPVYQDVPPSPPGYPVLHDAELIEYEDLERLDARRSSVDPEDE